jgi:hypothetical protein
MPKHPLRYRYIRLWYTRHRPMLRQHGGFFTAHLGDGVMVLGYAGRLTGLVRPDPQL